MADSFNDYHKWEQHLAEVKLPKWDELPKFDLYMDQVVAYVNDTLGPLDVDSVTPALIKYFGTSKEEVSGDAGGRYLVDRFAEANVFNGYNSPGDGSSYCKLIPKAGI